MQIFAFAGVREYQAANKLAVDGDYGKECSNRAGFLTALEDEARLLIAEMDKKDLTMSDIKSSRPTASAIQEVLNLLGYEIGYQKYGADGRFGPASMQALDNFMEDQVISSYDMAINDLAMQLLRMYGGVKYFRNFTFAFTYLYNGPLSPLILSDTVCPNALSTIVGSFLKK